METVPRISYLLQRALVRISRETQRLSRTFGFCSKQEVTSAFRVVLAPGLADSSTKVGHMLSNNLLEIQIDIIVKIKVHSLMLQPDWVRVWFFI